MAQVRSQVQFLPAERARYLVELAERARAGLARFCGQDVQYGATSVQLLDEWIDRHLRQFPSPSQEMRLLWTAYLGELFRRRHGGEWCITPGSALAVVCPVEDNGGILSIPVADQIGRRIAKGMAESLSVFYMEQAIKLRGG